jgi:hypothetical protein
MDTRDNNLHFLWKRGAKEFSYMLEEWLVTLELFPGFD